MPDKKDKQTGLLVSAATAAALGIGVSALGRRSNITRKPRTLAPEKVELVSRVAKTQSRLERMLEEQRDFREAERVRAAREQIHPRKRAAEHARDVNPQAYKRTVQRGRLAKRAAKAASRRMGAVGAVVGAPSMVESAQRVEKEGGSFQARFGKFVEEMLGVQMGTSGRPLTAAEERSRRTT
jgi:hypothetical protein